MEHAICQAQEVFDEGVWSRASVQHRSSVLSNLARSLESRVNEIAALESLQTGNLYILLLYLRFNKMKTGRAIREMKVQLGRLPEW